MIIFRISSLKRATDLSGNGAKLYGGRWNSVGQSVIYTSENISLCMLEILVHAARSSLKAPFALVKIEVPASAMIKTIPENILPADWQIYPHPISTQTIGTQWLESCESLLLKVPSSANTFEANFLINPNHLDFAKVKIVETEIFHFEQRLIKVG